MKRCHFLAELGGLSLRLALALLTAGLLGLPRLRAAEGRVFEGVDLSKLREAQKLSATPEIYVMDPGSPRYRMADSAFHLPLSGAWLVYNPNLGVSYLNKVPGENEASYFGPIKGDPFVQFRLEERMIADLTKAYAPDAEYRLKLMVRSGHPKMRERALRIMTAVLAPAVPLDLRFTYIGTFRDVLSTLKGDDAAAVQVLIQQAVKRDEELVVTLPDDVYAPGNETLEKQGQLKDWMKLPGPVPAEAWGEPVEGLRAAAVFSTTTPNPGDKVDVWLLVENKSDHEIRFASHDVMQTARAAVKNADGKEISVGRSWFTGLSPILRHKLRPGERLTLAKKSLVFAGEKEAGNAGFGEERAATGPGEYRVHYESVLATGTSWSHDRATGEARRTTPAKGEWSGRLATGETKVRVTAKPADGPPPEKGR
jgi:hypothetical protein